MPGSENLKNRKNQSSSKLSQNAKQPQPQQETSELSTSTNEPSLNQSKLNGDITKSDPTVGVLNPTGVKTLLVVISLACVCLTGFMSRLFSVIRYESIIHEFDPWWV